MNSLVKIALQMLLYLAFGLAIGYFSVLPSYRHAAPETAQIKLSLSHAARRVKPCIKLTPEQLAEVAANMRQAEKCERERLPLTVELEIDGEVRLHLVASPSGLWNDGPASIYERFEIEAGDHAITARLRDSNRNNGWDYTHSEDVSLEPGRYLAITFRRETGGFSFR